MIKINRNKKIKKIQDVVEKFEFYFKIYEEFKL